MPEGISKQVITQASGPIPKGTREIPKRTSEETPAPFEDTICVFKI